MINNFAGKKAEKNKKERSSKSRDEFIISKGSVCNKSPFIYVQVH